ncbi:MAG: thioredoxin domain-containing protein [Candidatus Omnitrophica bacterium]|nr:thioredoxin domain-containing protein [Candidatus Omnitrophota bacterium]
MKLLTRYAFTAVAIVLFLVSLVSIGRFLFGGSAFASYGNLKVKGPESASVRVVVYSDFQCPACFHANAPLEELKNQFPDSLALEFRHFPLERPHRWALLAATFAECAAEQDKFWEFHEKLFSTQEIWSKSEDAIPFFAQYAQEAGLDHLKMGSCLEDPKTIATVRRDHSMGVKQKVQSTPTIFINGRILVGALQLKEQGSSIVLEELKKSKKV